MENKEVETQENNWGIYQSEGWVITTAYREFEEVQRIHELGILQDDNQAVVLAKAKGFKFENPLNPYAITAYPYSTKNLECSLIELQDNTIGLFQWKPKCKLEMVIRNDVGWLKTIHIGDLGGLQTNHIGANQGQYIEFPDGKNLTEMMSNPFELNDFCEKFIR